MSAFDIFDATDVPGLTAQMNVLGGNLETAVTELRGAILMQGAEQEAMRNGLALIEQRTEQVTQFGGKAVAELDAIMTSFRAEIVLNKSERIAEGEALKGELRQLVVDLQAKFLEVEGAIGTLTATAAAAAATGPSRQDPWFLPGQPSPGQPARFAMDVDDELSRPVSALPASRPRRLQRDLPVSRLRRQPGAQPGSPGGLRGATPSSRSKRATGRVRRLTSRSTQRGSLRGETVPWCC